ncbi:putative 2OG-Fe(II) oxygenase [Erythrobacter sp. sf7]|uniref:2OG-Fe(II) oxygenase n=1 Tax=Erythrobacter fulvus TaxID=2987523 RepID=A0ABT5JN32_9SPHN|nr:putative 2OG-Fe(II) oxygenase [Erythrobacter fulvus]MDC8754059.1 putative 2OG-Fe(II) oxygenase [Erythrobacter fulvus]
MVAHPVNIPTPPANAAAALLNMRMMLHSGNAAGARTLAEQARRAFPDDAPLADAAGDLAMKAGDVPAAEAHFAAACAAAPQVAEYAVNQAIALQQLGRHGEAVQVLARHDASGRRDARHASVRALSERALGHPAAAAQWYDVALSLEPTRLRALHGRARVALERGEADAVARFDRALAVSPGDADLWLGKAQALEVAGDVTGARVIAEQIVQQAPGFLAGLTFLSGLRLAAGEADFTAPFRDAAARVPQDPNIPATHIETLAGLDHAGQAAEVAAEARRRFPNEAHFALLEAIHAGSAGDYARADAIFAALADERPLRFLHEARHRLRGRDPEAAERLLVRVLASDPWDISAWALRGMAWRLADDPRAEWLHDQAGLVQLRPLVGREGLVAEAIAELRRLHAASSMPLGQSLRGGTQTRGILFHRTEPVLAELHAAIHATLETYRAQLPPRDDTHPLLRHREAPWQLLGSWSVRLTGGGTGAGDYHTAHIHPQGIVSSALYLVVPDEAEDEQLRRGWLEVGRPPPDLRLDLEPLKVIRPREAHLALFPSTLYHGTTAFGSARGSAAERMTVAFDVVTSEEQTA